jgi:dihydrofolate reductase
MKAVAAMSKGRVLGINGKLPWPTIKEDFKWFRELTLNKTILIGRKTYDSFGRGYLPKRQIIVASNTENWEKFNLNVEDWFYVRCGKIVADDAPEDVIICGGSKIYELFMPRITEFYITHVTGEYEGDTFMPPFEHLLPKQSLVKEFDGHRVVKYSK